MVPLSVVASNDGNGLANESVRYWSLLIALNAFSYSNTGSFCVPTLSKASELNLNRAK